MLPKNRDKHRKFTACERVPSPQVKEKRKARRKLDRTHDLLAIRERSTAYNTKIPNDPLRATAACLSQT